MMVTLVAGNRAEALERAEVNAPVLRTAAAALPEIASAFVEAGGETAVAEALMLPGDTVGERLRRQRHGLALAVALADLSGEQTLEWGPNDIFVVPPWTRYAHTAPKESVLFSISDRPMQENLGIWREGN